MSPVTAEILVKGRITRVPAAEVGGHRVVCEGWWPRIARLFDEIWLDASPITNPEQAIEAIRTSDIDADIFSFAQMLPEIEPQYSYYHDWDNLAAAPTTNFQAWWEGLPQESRKNVRKSQKRGVVVRPVKFDDALVHGIKAIYDETPLRQGRRFWHYGKDLETVRKQNSTYLERSHFIGAFLDDELIGFIKMVVTGSVARIMQILSKNQHYDKHPMNALVARAMEVCSRGPVTHLIYGQYIYGNKRNSSVTEFKRRNGFIEVLLPRYYVPLTWKGHFAISTKLYREIGQILPEPVINFALEARGFANSRVFRRFKDSRAAAGSS